MTGARLIVNADDFGFTDGVNEGIVAAHRLGILTSTTLMANAPAFEGAVRLAKENPTLDVGCHLVLLQGEGLPGSIPSLLFALATAGMNLHSEMERQLQKILDTGIQPSHLDTHKHTHLAPSVLNAMIRISRTFGIPWIRKPVDFPMRASAAPHIKRVVHGGVRFLARRLETKLHASGCRTTDHFTGFQLTGRLGTPELLTLIRELPDGLTELMCHPGFLTDELRNSRTRLKESRVVEYEALISPAVREALNERGARLVSYRDL